MRNSFSIQQVLAFRLARHHLSSSKPAKASSLARDACGIQAQLFSAAELSLWARLHKLKRSDIHAALWKERSLVKTSCMRGTLHLLAASDYPIYMRALEKSRMKHIRAVMSRYHVTPAEGDAVTEAVVEALSAGPLTRSQLTARVFELGIVQKNAKPFFITGWWGVVRQAIVQGLICFATDRGQETSYARVEQWLPGLANTPRDEAAQLLLRRYLSAFGPANLRDFAYWSGMPASEAREVWETLREEMIEVEVEGQKLWLLRRDRSRLADCEPACDSLRLLPNFDSYMLGHAKKDHLFEERWYKRIYRDAGWISPVILVNGQPIAVWSLRRQRKRLSVSVEPFVTVPRVLRGKVEEEVASLGQFLELPWEVSYSS